MNAEDWMKMALELAQRARPNCLPNPAVGAVIVQKGEIVGKGYTQKPGGNHAEIMALQAAGSKARGAELFVTLEPCSHFGRTPPCTQALVESGIGRVYVACIDPNPLVGGKGLKHLAQAGIEVIEMDLPDEVEKLYGGYFFKTLQGRPKIILKIAQSLDGKINARAGKRTAISGSEALKYGHELRVQCDAVVCGAETLRIDDPNLYPRLTEGPNPDAVILAGAGKLPRRAQVFSKIRTTRTIVLSGIKHDLPNWVQQPLGTGSSPYLKARKVVNELGKLNYHSVLVEGGTEIWRLFLKSGIWDELHVITSPAIFPKGQFAFQSLTSWGSGAQFHNFAVLGKDIVWVLDNLKRK